MLFRSRKSARRCFRSLFGSLLMLHALAVYALPMAAHTPIAGMSVGQQVAMQGAMDATMDHCHDMPAMESMDPMSMPISIMPADDAGHMPCCQNGACHCFATAAVLPALNPPPVRQCAQISAVANRVPAVRSAVLRRELRPPIA